MANSVLFRSSVAMALAHGAAILLWRTWLADGWLTLVYVVGVLTSLINHGLTSPVYVWTDRLWMALGCATDAVYIQVICPHSWERACLAALQVSYITAFLAAKALIQRSGGKNHVGNAPHLATHTGATVLHCWLLYRTSHRLG